MRLASKRVEIGLLLVSLVAAGFMPCVCSDMTNAGDHEHCARAASGVRMAERGCECPCMKAYEPPEAVSPTAVNYTPAPAAVPFTPPLDIAWACVSEPPRGLASFAPSPPLAPPLVLRI